MPEIFAYRAQHKQQVNILLAIKWRETCFFTPDLRALCVIREKIHAAANAVSFRLILARLADHKRTYKHRPLHNIRAFARSRHTNYYCNVRRRSRVGGGGVQQEAKGGGRPDVEKRFRPKAQHSSSIVGRVANARARVSLNSFRLPTNKNKFWHSRKVIAQWSGCPASVVNI